MDVGNLIWKSLQRRRNTFFYETLGQTVDSFVKPRTFLHKKHSKRAQTSACITLTLTLRVPHHHQDWQNLIGSCYSRTLHPSKNDFYQNSSRTFWIIPPTNCRQTDKHRVNNISSGGVCICHKIWGRGQNQSGQLSHQTASDYILRQLFPNNQQFRFL